MNAPTAIRVLVLEDSAGDADLMVRALRDAGFQVAWERAEGRADFTEALKRKPDLVLSDYHLPQFTGVEALKITRAQGLDVPFLLVSGSIGEEVAVEAMRDGADDYLLKDRMARLGEAARRALERRRLRAQEKDALRETRRLVAIVENSNDAIISRTLDGTVTSWNAGAERIFGYAASEAIGKPIAQLINPPEVHGRVEDNARRIRHGEIVPPYESRGLTKGGKLVDVLTSVSPIRDDDGKIAGAAIILRNISERKQAERALARLNRVLAVLGAINALIARARDRDTLFREACRIAVREGDFGIAWIGTFDAETLEVTPVTIEGLPAEGHLETSRVELREGAPSHGSIVARAIRERRPIYNNDITVDPPQGGRRTREAVRRGYRSAAALPLMSDGRVVGTFALFARDANYFNDEEISLLNELAGNISFALEHLARQEKIHKLSRIRAVSSGINEAIARVGDRDALLQRVCWTIVHDGEFDVAWAGLCDPSARRLTPVSWVGEHAETLARIKPQTRDDAPYGVGVAGRAIMAKAPVVINDLSAEPDIGSERRRVGIALGFRSTVALPIMVEGEVVGALTIYAREANFFDEEEVQLLTEIAGNVSFALVAIARREKIDRLTRIREVLGEINAAIVRIKERKTLCQAVARIAVEQGRFGMSWVSDIDPVSLDAVPIAWAGEGVTDHVAYKSTARADTPVGLGVVGQAVRTRKPAICNDLTAEVDVGSPRRRLAISRGYRSLAGLPLIVDGSVAAVVTLYAREAQFFDDEEVALLSEMAGNISFALENMAKQEKIDKLSRIRDVMSEINAAIVRTHDQDSLFRETCRIAAEHGGFAMSWIAHVDVARRSVRPVAWNGFPDEAARAVTWDSMEASRGTMMEAIETRGPSLRNHAATPLPAGTLRELAVRHGCQSFLTLPIVLDGRVVAIVALFAKGENFFDDEELALLQEVAGDLAFALGALAHQERVEKLSRIRDVMSEINAAIVRIHDRQELFAEACRIATDVGGLPFAWIGTYDRDAKQVKPVAWTGSATAYLESVRAPRPVDDTASGNQGMVATAVLDGKAVIVNDVQSDPRVLRKEMHLQRGINSLAVLPFIVSGEVAGVIALHARETGFFDDEEVALLFELAGDLALALQTMLRQERVDYLSYYDPLTGLPNRTLFLDRLSQQLHGRSGEPRMVALMLLNVERTRYVNDTLGRHAGDELLKRIGARLEAAFDGKEHVARVGGDGFGIVMRGIRDASGVLFAVESRALECFHEPFVLGSTELRVSARAGIAVFPADGADADALFKNAEAALEKARESGEPYLFYAADMNARVAHALLLESRLRKAVEARQFVLHYQPKIALATGAVCGLEALIRWQQPDGTLVAPGTFIPLLEETGLILEVGKWVIARALEDYREWTARGCRVPRISVNVSSKQLERADFVDAVVGAVREAGDNPGSLELEITESLLMRDSAASIDKLSRLRGLGIQIAIDDFGTGYSSLSYLARLPISSLKIDRSFVSAMAAGDQDLAIISTIITLAHSLKLNVVAEGVETQHQARLLKSLMCDEAQGYLYSRPLPAGEIPALLRVRKRKRKTAPAAAGG